MKPNADKVDQARAGESVGAGAARGRSPLKFFLLGLALSFPFWLVGAATDRQLMPGLSVSALMAFCPLAAASILLYRVSGSAGVAELLKKSFDFGRIKSKRWLIPVLFLMPAVNAVVYGLMCWMDMLLPAQEFPWVAALLMLLAPFAGALGEELGWSGYVIDPLQDRWNALKASLALGGVGMAWHNVPLLLIHRPPT